MSIFGNFKYPNSIVREISWRCSAGEIRSCTLRFRRHGRPDQVGEGGRPLSQAWGQQCDIQQMEGEVWRSRTHGRQTKSADRILVSVLDYPAVGNVSKGGKNGIPIHGHAPYRSAIVVQRLRYPLNETEDVTAINCRAVWRPAQSLS